MPALMPFRAWRYAPNFSLDAVTAPPYDVLSSGDVQHFANMDAHNIVHVDVPPQTPDGYADAGARLRDWMTGGELVRDPAPTLTLYRLLFRDATGAHRQITGLLGALPVTDYGTSQVLPHEQVTAKASTDRLDLTRATNANLSPVWGLSLASGLTDLLTSTWDDAVAAGAKSAGLSVGDGASLVTHQVLPITDPNVIDAIDTLMAPADVLIADGHHRYGVAQRYRDEVGASSASDSEKAAAALTLAFVNELVEEQLCVEAIHRVYDGAPFEALRSALSVDFELSPAPEPSPAVLAHMVELGRLVLLSPDGTAYWLTPKPGAFDGLRALDGLWLEHALAGVSGMSVDYEHDLDEVLAQLPRRSGAVLIRPTSIDEIRRTATEGLLMPPKSTFFTPKPRTGLVLRTMDE